MNKAYLGSTLDSFFEKKGNLEAVRLLALKKMIAEMFAEAMEKQRLTVAQVSRRMNTSRAAVTRILDPRKTGLTLETLERAAHVVGCMVQVQLVPPVAIARPIRSKQVAKKRSADKLAKRLAG